MRSRLNRKIGFIAGLLAILMMTLAPAISQSLRSNEHADMAAHDGACPMASMQDDMHDDAASPAASPTDHAALHHGDACGFCHFFSHAPALPSAPVLFTLTVRAIQQRVASRYESVRRVLAFTAAQPRAPPRSS
jgi:hypothetical protein